MNKVLFNNLNKTKKKLDIKEVKVLTQFLKKIIIIIVKKIKYNKTSKMPLT